MRLALSILATLLWGAIPARADTGPDRDYQFVPTRIQVRVWGGLTTNPDGSLRDQREGPRAGEPVVYREISCRSGVRTTSCDAAPAPPTLPLHTEFLERLNACFRVTRDRSPPPNQRAIATLISSHGLRKPLALGKLPAPRAKAGHAFLGVALHLEREVDESKTVGCENPPPGVGCDPVAMPTGRRITVTDEAFGARGPGTYDLGGAWPSAPVFPSADLEASWLVIFRADKSKIDDLLLTGKGDVAAQLQQFRARVEPWLERKPGPTLRAALLVNLTIAAFATGDRAGGRALLAKLEAHAANRGIDRKALRLDDSLPHLRRLAAGEWSATDPCASAPAATR
ncbi:MAG: hypothetical protein SFX73_12240 [Kofleriaceae bacterium]|nr:hypothetical protein [Kofleriaceae bacterium]